MSSVPPNARRNTHSEAASSSQLRLAHSRTRRSSARSAMSSSSRSPTWRRAAAAVSGSKCSLRPSQRRNVSARPWPCSRPSTSRATTSMMPRPARAAVTYSGLTPRSGIEISRAIQKMQVEHDGRAEAGGGQGEAGVGAADARQREQPVAERRAGGAAAGHDVAERLGAHLDAEHPQPRDLGAGLAERRAGQQRVGEPRRDLQEQAGDEERRLDLGELGRRAAEAGDQRQDEEVDDRREGDDLDASARSAGSGGGRAAATGRARSAAARPSRGRSATANGCDSSDTTHTLLVDDTCRPQVCPPPDPIRFEPKSRPEWP